MGSKDPSDKDSYEVEVNLTASQEIPRKRRRVRKQTDLLSPDEIASIKRADTRTVEEMPAFDDSLDYSLDPPRPTHELEEAPAPPETEVPDPERAMAPTEREVPRFAPPEDPRTRQPTVTMTPPKRKTSTLMPVLIALACMLGLVGGVGVGLFFFMGEESVEAPEKTGEDKGAQGPTIDLTPAQPEAPAEKADAGAAQEPTPKQGREHPQVPEETPTKGEPRYRMVD